MFDMWKDILKNIQISGQRGKTKDIRLPPKEDDDEDCFKYFYNLVKLMHPDFELKRQIYPDQSDDFWCRVKDTGWDNRYSDEDTEIYLMGEGVREPNWSEIEIFYTMDEDFNVNPPRKNIEITLQMPESYEPEVIQVFFKITNEDYYKNRALDGNKVSYRYIDNIEQIWKKMQQYMGV